MMQALAALLTQLLHVALVVLAAPLVGRQLCQLVSVEAGPRGAGAEQQHKVGLDAACVLKRGEGLGRAHAGRFVSADPGPMATRAAASGP